MGNKVLAQYKPRHQEIRGHPDEVAALLRAASRQGRLGTDPAVIRGSLRWLPDGRASVWATIAEPVPPPRRPHPVAREVGRAGMLALGFTALVGGLLIAAFYGLVAVAGAVMATPGVRSGFALALVLLILWLIRSVSSGHACRGIHCDGCSRR